MAQQQGVSVDDIWGAPAPGAVAPAAPVPVVVAAPAPGEQASAQPALDLSQARPPTASDSPAPDLGQGYWRTANGTVYRDTGYAPGAASGALATPSPPAPAPQPGGVGVDDIWPTASPQSAPPEPSAAEEVGAGGVKGVLGIPNFASIPQQVLSSAETLTGAKPGSLLDNVEYAYDPTRIGSDAIGAVTGWNPSAVPQNTPAERIEQAVGGGLSTALIPGGEETRIPDLIRNAALGVLGGGASQGAVEAAPDAAKPFVGLPAAVATTLLAHGGGKIAQIGARAAIDPFTAAMSSGAAESQAGQRIAGAATAKVPQLQAAVAAPAEIVPGSAPTVPQLTQDPGLISLQRKVAQRTPAGTPDPFAQRNADQNAARVSALQGVQTGGDPAAVSGLLRGQLADIDQASDAQVATAAQAAQQASARVGGTAAPEEYGAALRGSLADAETAARAKESALWQAVDPDGTMTGNVGQTSAAAKQIAGSVPATAKPMDGEEGAIFDTASKLPAVSPVGDLIALRSRVSSAMRQELMTQGRTPSYARLSQLRGAIEDNLGSTISDAVTSQQQQIAAGQLAPERSIAANVQAQVNDFYQRRAATAATGTADASGNSGNAGRGSVAVPGMAGAEVPAGGGPGNAAGRPGGAPGAPTFDSAAAQRLAAATESTRQRVAIFGQNPVASALRSAGAGDLYKMPDGSLPGKFFHAGPNGFTDMQAALKAAPQSSGVLADYAALTLRRETMNADGVVDPAKFSKWQAKYQDSLRALPPEVQARFANAATAGQTMADAGQARVQALQDARAGALGRVMGVTEPQDVTSTVGSILAGSTSAADMKLLAQKARNNPAAFQGLRQAVTDNLAGRFVGPDGTLNASGLKTFVGKNRAAISQVLSPDEMGTLDAISTDYDRSQSATTMRVGADSRPPPEGHKYILDLVGGAMGAGLGSLHGGGGAGAMVGDILGTVATHVAQSLRANGVAKVNDLVSQALLNPQLASKLLAKVPANRPGATQAAVRGVIASLAAAHGQSSGATLTAPPPQR